MTRSFHYCSLLLFTIFFIARVQAQHPVYIALKGGISIPDLSGGNNHINPLKNGYKSSLRGDYGVQVEFQINHWLTLQPEICYSQEGGKNVGLQAFYNPYPNLVDQPYLYANYKSEVKLDYLMFPITAKFNFPITNKWKFYINAGGWGGFVLAAKSVTEGNSLVYLDAAGRQEQQVYPGAVFSFYDKEDIKDSLKSFNVGAIMYIGFSYAVGRGKVFVEGGGNYGFRDLQKNNGDGTNHSGAFVAHIGYAYGLKRRSR